MKTDRESLREFCKFYYGSKYNEENNVLWHNRIRKLQTPYGTVLSSLLSYVNNFNAGRISPGGFKNPDTIRYHVYRIDLEELTDVYMKGVGS